MKWGGYGVDLVCECRDYKEEEDGCVKLARDLSALGGRTFWRRKKDEG